MPMATDGLRKEESIGLVLALAAHAGLFALLMWKPPGATILPPPERIEVTLSEDVGLTSSSPEPAAAPAPDTAPELGEPALKPEAAPLPEPAPVPKPAPRFVPEPVPVPQPLPRPAASPKPVVRPVPKSSPSPRITPQPAVRPTPRTAPPLPGTSRTATASPLPGTSRTAPQTPVMRPGGTRVGNDFLQGVQGAKPTGTARAVPATAIGADVRSSLVGAISRQIKPHWKIPQGADAELLVSILSFDLNADGTLVGRPRLVRQEGVTDANRSQAARHAEQAIRAVQLASPFDLPPQYFEAWKRATFRFDRRLSQ